MFKEKFKEGFGLVFGLYAGARFVCFVDELIKKCSETNERIDGEVKATTKEEE